VVASAGGFRDAPLWSDSERDDANSIGGSGSGGSACIRRCGGTKQSSSSTATSAAAQPVTPIKILTPHDGTKTSADHITISGTASPDQTLAYLDDPGATGLQPVQVGPNGDWTVNAPLAVGQNSIEFVGKGSKSPSL
jgi:hypothetical protein